jgi:hypothetical protein
MNGQGQGLSDLHEQGHMSTKKTIVYILSTNYSGSHYLSLMLGSHSRAMHLGEIHRVREPRRQADLCFACRHRARCRILGNIALPQFRDTYEVIFSRVDAGVDTLVDNSKLADRWVEHFLDDDRYERKYIHLIRDPRALVRRWLLQPRSCKREVLRFWRLLREHPGRVLRSPVASFRHGLTYQWLQQNQRITRMIEQHRLEAQIVTYHDLAKNPEVELQRLTGWIGLPFEPDQLEYWHFEHHGTQKAEYEWIKEERTRHIDLRWQTDLSPSFQQRIIDHVDVRAYLQSLDLHVADDGLTRLDVQVPKRYLAPVPAPARTPAAVS